MRIKHFETNSESPTGPSMACFLPSARKELEGNIGCLGMTSYTVAPAPGAGKVQLVQAILPPHLPPGVIHTIANREGLTPVSPDQLDLRWKQ